MGTTLTGTTPQDTYDSLIKVTDNGPLSGSLKKLTDGLGNDSSLSLSTTAASFSGTLAVSGASTFSGAVTMALGGTPRLTLQDTDAGAGNVGILFKESTSDKWTLASSGGAFQFFNEATASNALYITSTNNVGIGTSSPSGFTRTLKINAASGTIGILLADGDTDRAGFYVDAGDATPAYIFTNYTKPLVISVAGAERARFTPNGLTFNGDTAAANALDDYEEGTFTATLTPSTSGSFSLFSTFQTLSYTKIGRQVTVKGLLIVQSASSPVGTEVIIGGLPFVTLNASSGRGSGSVFVAGNSFSSGNYHTQNASTFSVIYNASTISGLANSDFYITFTYFV